MHTSEAPQVKRLLFAEFALTLILTAVAIPFGTLVALSVLIGAGTCSLASAVFAFWVFRDYRAQQPSALVTRFYAAEVVKLAVVLGLFALAFATVGNLNLPVLLAAYVAVQVLPAISASFPGATPKRQR